MSTQQEAGTPPRIAEVEMNEEKMVPRRVTVGLTQRVRAELWELMDTTRLSVTDVVNRAVSIYRLITAHQAAGYELVLRHRDTGRERIVEIL